MLVASAMMYKIISVHQVNASTPVYLKISELPARTDQWHKALQLVLLSLLPASFQVPLLASGCHLQTGCRPCAGALGAAASDCVSGQQQLDLSPGLSLAYSNQGCDALTFPLSADDWMAQTQHSHACCTFAVLERYFAAWIAVRRLCCQRVCCCHWAPPDLSFSGCAALHVCAKSLHPKMCWQGCRLLLKHHILILCSLLHPVPANCFKQIKSSRPKQQF